MVTRLCLLLFLCSYSLTEEVSIKLVDGDHARRVRVHRAERREIFIQRRRDAAAAFNHRFIPDGHSHDVIFAPLNGKSIITKENMYINGNSIQDQDVYEDIVAGRRRVDDLDDFFVTPPPARTTVAVSLSNDVRVKTLPTLHRVSGGSDVPPERTTVTPLKLVTLPPPTTTQPPPFKYTTKMPLDVSRSHATAGHYPTSPLNPTSIIRFPAQPWQIPPRDTNRQTSNIWDMFQPNRLLNGMPPDDPFKPTAFNLTNPFIPIGVSDPMPPLRGLQPVNSYRTPYSNQMTHKSPLRVGFSKNPEQNAIPLPIAGLDSGNSGFPTLLKTSNKQPDLSFSIDDKRQQGKEEVYKRPFAKTFKGTMNRSHSANVDSSSEKLRSFAKTHPNIVSTMKRPSFRGQQIVTPKSKFGRPSRIGPSQKMHIDRSAERELPAPIQPGSSGLNPNQKLDLCCRKQRVNQFCQAMCNFDTFNDKTLVSAFLTNQCPGPQLGQAFDCASSKVDHSECCERNGLGQFQGGRCMPFCRTHQDTPPNVLEYVPCLQVFDTIKQCYREYQLSNKNLFGD